MTWPTVAVTTTNTDAGTDSPATARTDILDLMTKSNQMIAHVSTFGASVLDDANAAAARATLGAAASGANSDITSLTALIGNGLLPVGTIITHAASTAPSGYLKANGALVSRSTYAALFTVIGTTFGAGDGSTTFALPDLRGEFIRGWDDARGIDSGRAIGTFQADDLKSHNHTFTAVQDVGGNRYPGGGVGISQSGTTGSTGGTETRPRNIALLACIKY